MTPPIQEISETFGDGKITADEIRLMIEIGTLIGVGAVSAFLTWLWGKFKEWRRNRKKKKKHLQLFSMDQMNLSIYEKLLYLIKNIPFPQRGRILDWRTNAKILMHT